MDPDHFYSEWCDARTTADAARGIAAAPRFLLSMTAPFDGGVTARTCIRELCLGLPLGQAGAQPTLQGCGREAASVGRAGDGSTGRSDEERDNSFSFTVTDYPGERFKARIRRILGEVAPDTRTMPVELDVQNRDGKLSPGSFTTATLPLQRGYHTLLVPALQRDDRSATHLCHPYTKQQAQWVTEQTVLTVTGESEVFGNLGAGDQVTKAASDAIHSGDRVQDQTY